MWHAYGAMREGGQKPKGAESSARQEAEQPHPRRHPRNTAQTQHRHRTDTAQIQNRHSTDTEQTKPSQSTVKAQSTVMFERASSEKTPPKHTQKYTKGNRPRT